MSPPSPRTGIFSTLPVEVLLAAGHTPVDVNNLFVTHPDAAGLLRLADDAGLPRNLCAWTRGLYGACVAQRVDRVVVVPQGDCTNNVTMARLLQRTGTEVLEFNFPIAAPDRAAALALEIERFAAQLGTTRAAVDACFEALRPLRRRLAEVDVRHATRRLPGSVARQWLIASTDVGGDPDAFVRHLDGAMARDYPPQTGVPVAVFGIPTIVSDLAATLERLGAFVALCETEVDFAMLPPATDIVEQYLSFAYPWGIEERLEKFLRLCADRGVAGVVINQQAFCHHNLELPRVERALAPLPTLVVESDLPGPLSPRDQVRVEAFVATLRTAPRRGPPAEPETPAPALSLDLGSRFAKVMARRGTATWRESFDTVPFYRRFARRADGRLTIDLPALLAALNCPFAADDGLHVVATGYGRNLVRFANARVLPELAAHAAGASAQVEDDRFLLLDVGGQDSKAILVRDGAVEAFVMNDKCAAGGGRYVENMARLLDLPLAQVTAHSADPVTLTNVCATFGESEVIGAVVDGVPLPRICAGIMQSVAERTAQLVTRLPPHAGVPVWLAGGLADSAGLRALLAGRLLVPGVNPLPEPRFNGALGCLEHAWSTASGTFSPGGKPSG